MQILACPKKTEVPNYESIKFIRWGGAGSNGTLAMTPCEEKAFHRLLKTAGIPEPPGGARLLYVHEPWLEDLLFQLTMQLLMHGVSVTDETLTATLRALISDPVSPATPVGAETGNRKRNREVTTPPKERKQ